MKDVVVYVDESGVFNANAEDIENSFYIIVAVVVDAEKRMEFEEEYLKAVKEVNQSDFMKSVTLFKKKNHLRYFSEIESLDFTYHAIIFDQRSRLINSGLNFKSVQYKYLHNLIYSRLIYSYNSLEFISDDYGDDKFKTQFAEYIKKNSTEKELFKTINIEFKSKDKVVQLADIIAGILKKYYFYGSNEVAYNLIKKKSITHIHFGKSNKINSELSDKRFKDKTSLIAIKNAEARIDTVTNSISKDILSFLILSFWSDPIKFVYAQEIKEYIDSINREQISIDSIRQEYIHNLRDLDFMIVSGNKGYKIPYSLDDYKTYANKIQNNMIPALRRLNSNLSTYSGVSNIPRYKLYKEMGRELLYKLIDVIEKDNSYDKNDKYKNE